MIKPTAASTEKVSALRASGFASGVNGTYHDMHTANGSWTKTDGPFYNTTAGHSWRLRGAKGEGGDPVYAARRRDGQQCDCLPLKARLAQLGCCICQFEMPNAKKYNYRGDGLYRHDTAYSL
jgi:hypothetical protein